MDPVVSVIIPAYNSGKYIEETLQSVVEQTYTGNIEIIVVDDCSGDNTYEIVQAFSENCCSREDRSMIVLKNAVNSGVAASRNNGVAASSGKYICYLDSDDFWDRSKVEKQVSAMEKMAAGGNCPPIICTARECVDENSQSIGKTMNVPEVITYKAMLKTNLVPCSSVMLTREAAVRFPMERDDIVEDYIDWLKIIKEFGPAAGINEPLLKYRILKGSRSANKLKAAKSQYKALRYVGLSVPKSVIYLVSYGVNGVIKHS